VNDRDWEIVRFVARQGFVKLRELEDWIARRWNVGIRGAWRIVDRLVKQRVLRRRRISRALWVELHPEFIAMISEVYAYILGRSPHRARYFERRIEETEEME